MLITELVLYATQLQNNLTDLCDSPESCNIINVYAILNKIHCSFCLGYMTALI
jgi:hypothetical protein